jgi:hypothetical protein
MLARFANTAKISVIRRLPESRRLATLVAFASNLEAVAFDDALDLLDILITEIFSNAARASDKARMRTIKNLDGLPCNSRRCAGSSSIRIYKMLNCDPQSSKRSNAKSWRRRLAR